MKKVLLMGAFVVLGTMAMTSCKKDYKCVANGVTVSECTGCGSTEKTAFDTSCALVGGTVSEK